MSGRWPVWVLLGATAFAVGLLFCLPSPRSGGARPLPESAPASLPAPMPRTEAPALSAPEPPPASALSLPSASPPGAVAERVLGMVEPAAGPAGMNRQETLALLATRYVYIGFTEFNENRRGTLLARGDHERLTVREGDELDGMSVRALDRERCILVQEPYTYTLYMVDLDYIERARTELPLPVPSAEDRAKRRRYYEEMFARPERARNTRVSDLPYPARPLSPEEVEAGKQAYVDQHLAPKLERVEEERQSGANPHPEALTDPRQANPWDPLKGPPAHPSQLRPLMPEEHREAFRRYWEREWPGRTWLPGADVPPPPPADLTEIVIERRQGTR